jgi:hypothetical protein
LAIIIASATCWAKRERRYGAHYSARQDLKEISHLSAPEGGKWRNWRVCIYRCIHLSRRRLFIKATADGGGDDDKITMWLCQLRQQSNVLLILKKTHARYYSAGSEAERGRRSLSRSWKQAALLILSPISVPRRCWDAVATRQQLCLSTYSISRELNSLDLGEMRLSKRFAFGRKLPTSHLPVAHVQNRIYHTSSRTPVCSVIAPVQE